MKRILGLVLVMGLGGALIVMAQEVKVGQVQIVDLGKGVKLEMVLIPNGKFNIGDARIDLEVTISKPYYMGKYEVTQEQWEALIGNNPSADKGAKLPVTKVSWEDCQDFIKKLNAKTDGGYRLPTEAEWEFACRAGTTTPYWFGQKITPKDANYAKLEPVEVGSYKPNAFGLYDTHGNAWEWCQDWWAQYPSGSVIDPVGPITGQYRALRGGSFVNITGSKARSYDRARLTPNYREYTCGFRLAKTP